MSEETVTTPRQLLQQLVRDLEERIDNAIGSDCLPTSHYMKPVLDAKRFLNLHVYKKGD